MLSYAITFFVLAIVASILGFGGLAGTFSSIAQFLVIIFAVLFVASLIYNAITGRRAPTTPM